MKIIQDLGAAGFVKTTRGPHGGLELAWPTAEITIGQVVRHTEEDSRLVDCSACRIAEGCSLPDVFSEARKASLAGLDKCRLSDAARTPEAFRHLFVV